MANSNNEEKINDNKIVNQVKNMLSKTLKKTSIIIIIVLAVIIFIAGFYYILTDSFSKKVSEFFTDNKIQFDIVDGAIDIKDEELEKLDKIINSLEIDKQKLNLSKDDLRRIYLAEVLTQEICRVKPEEQEEGKYYGKVYVKRAGESTEDSDFLEYMPLEQFSQLNASEVLNYFSLDGDKICIADTVVKTDNDGNQTESVSIKKLEYKDKILKYMMPVEVLLDLCLITENPNFVLELANKVINETEIVLMVFQETETTETEIIEKFKIETETMERRDYYISGKEPYSLYFGPYINVGPEEEEPPIKQVTTVVNSSIKVSSIKSWFADQIYTYNKVVTQTKPDIPDEQLEDEPKKEHNVYKFVKIENGLVMSVHYYESEVTRRINRRKVTNVTIDTVTYQEGVEKEEKDKTEELLELFKKKFPISRSIEKRAAIGNILDSTDIFFNMLQNSGRTQTAEYVIRYMLYLHTGKYYGVTEFDFSMFEIRDFSTSTGGANLATYLRQFSHSDEAPKSPDGKFYKLYGDGKGWPTIGNADLQWKAHASKFDLSGKVLENGQEKDVANIRSYVAGFLTRGEGAEYTDQEVAAMNVYIEVGKVDEVGSDVQSVYYNSVQAETAGINLSKQQLYALTAIKYNFGHLPIRNGYTFREVYEEGAALYEIDSWQHNRFIWDKWWCHLGGGAAGHIPARDAAFETYAKGVYDFSDSPAGTIFSRNYYIYYTSSQLAMFSYAPNKTVTRTSANEEEIFTYIKGKGSSILEAAYEVHYIMEQSQENWSYSLGSGLFWNNIEMSLNNPYKVTCCATYVSSTLYYGEYLTEAEANSFNYNSSNELYNYLKNTKGWEEIPIFENIEAGDIIFMGRQGVTGIGHVQIYAGEGKWYNAGGDESIKRVNPYSITDSYVKGRFITALRCNE